MRRAALLIVPVAALIGLAAVQAEARSRAACRDYAQQVADHNVPSASAATTSGMDQDMAQDLVPDGGQGSGSAPAVDIQDGSQSSGAVLTGGGDSGRWQDVYQRAYAACRAS